MASFRERMDNEMVVAAECGGWDVVPGLTALELASEADTLIAAKDAEIAGLRAALEWIRAGRIGLDYEASDSEWRSYWSELCMQYRQKARAALAKAVGDG